MARKSIFSRISDHAIELTTETFHLGFAIAPVFAAIVSYQYGAALHLRVELSLIALVIIVNFSILGLRSKTDKTHELTLFRTFITNKLPPNRSGTKQTHDTIVAVIEDPGLPYFREALEKGYKSTFDVDKINELILNQRKNTKLRNVQLADLYKDIEDWNLYFKQIEIDPQNLEVEFDDHLEGASAVIVVQTDELNEKPWVFAALRSWANEHADVPILLARRSSGLFSDQPDASRFLWIPDDPKGLPWSLLHRGLSRAKMWRTQANFNRLIFWNMFYLSLITLYFGVIWIDGKNKESQTREAANRIVFKGMDEAISTERAFRALATVKDDSSLGVSYWYRLSGKPTIFVTTEVPHEYSQFENDNNTIIGCAFVKPNVVIEGTVSVGVEHLMVVNAYNNYDLPLPSTCQMKQLETSAIKSIVCASYDDSLRQNGGGTVGICVFTKAADNYLFGVYNRKYLLNRTTEFHRAFIDLIENSKEVSLMKRQETGPLPMH